MSDVSQGPGWWQASDGKWYPPESAPGGQAAAPQPQGFGAPVGGFNPAAPGVGPAGQTLATWPERAIGFLIEVVPVAVITGIFASFSFTLSMIMWLVSVGWWIYNGSLNGTTGQSIGKKVTGLRVVSEATGQPLNNAGAGILRAIYHFVDSLICYIGWLFPLWDAKRQTIADKIAKTVVVSGQQKHELNADLLKG